MKSDPFKPLEENLTKQVSFSEGQLSKVKDAFKVKTWKKKEYLLQPGSVSNNLYFVSSGCLRVFSLEDAKEIITQFGIQGWCVNDLTSYLTQKPATQYIQAIEQSVVLQIHRDVLEQLYDEVPPMERFFRIKFENAHNALQEHHLKSLNQTALERYEQFRLKYSELEQKVPQYMIASYLGITKEFLSHLRKNY